METINNKNKIAFFLNDLGGGGTEKSVSEIIKGINGDVFKCSIILKENKGIFLNNIPSNISIILINKSFIIFEILQIIKLIKKEKYDIFISLLPRENIVSLVAKIFIGNKIKFIISVRTTLSEIKNTIDKKKIGKFILQLFFIRVVKIMYPLADKIICVSNGVANDLYDIIGKSSKVLVIYNPLNIESIIELSKEDIDEDIINSNNFNILAIGRLIRAKDYPTMIRAVSLIKNNRPVKLIILGEGKEKNNLLKMVNDLNLEENVYFLGFKKNPYKYMTKVDLFVLSSMREGFPNVLVEAMACGVPVISTNCKSGPEEIIEDGKNGLLIPVGDEKSLSQAILKLMDDQDFKDKLKIEGKKITQKFSFEKSINNYENLFKELLK